MKSVKVHSEWKFACCPSGIFSRWGHVSRSLLEAKLWGPSGDFYLGGVWRAGWQPTVLATVLTRQSCSSCDIPERSIEPYQMAPGASPQLRSGRQRRSCATTWAPRTTPRHSLPRLPASWSQLAAEVHWWFPLPVTFGLMLLGASKLTSLQRFLLGSFLKTKQI